jgi:hypothetical protein
MYLIQRMVPLWEEMGWRVLEVRGLKGWPEADAVFLHVDLSVVPVPYAEQAQRYRWRWNAGALDIRKRRVLKDCLGPDSPHEGPVIVKTDLNYAGRPEFMNRVARSWIPGRIFRWCDGFAGLPALRKKEDYRIYPGLRDVPASVWADSSWVVQPFVTEREGGEYILREYNFLGAVEWLREESSPDPIITAGRLRRAVGGPVPEPLRALRRELKLDYGKIDYVMHEGVPYIYDVNKTIGTSQTTASMAMAMQLAGGMVAGGPD